MTDSLFVDRFCATVTCVGLMLKAVVDMVFV